MRKVKVLARHAPRNGSKGFYVLGVLRSSVANSDGLTTLRLGHRDSESIPPIQEVRYRA